jgi:hypothetical protein
MKTKYFIFAAAAALFAACSSDDAIVEQQVPQTVNDGAIQFDAYTNRSLTRAGVAGAITTTTLKTGVHKDAGFGVFGYYTDNGDYTQYAVPNFMYNQQVTWDGTSAWTYSPVKYWPNEFGPGATSDDVDKVTFFAYAPWIKVTAADGKPIVTTDQEKETNITQITKNTATGDLIIKYVVDTDPKTSVDLLWGVVPTSTGYASVSGSTAPTITPGLPYLDLVKAQTASRVSFNFLHALARFNVQIDYDKDVENPHTGTPADNHAGVITNTQTRIYVRSITFTGFAIKGALNLDNQSANEPLWYDYDGSKEITAGPVTYYDGRKDGKEATTNGDQRSEKPATLNPNIVQTEKCYIDDPDKEDPLIRKFGGEATTGVTNEAQNLFANTKTGGAATDPIFVIPTNDEMSVTIVYDVETIDPSLPTYLADGVTHGSSVENRITKESVFTKIEAGKSYTLKLHLGMTSVKFDAVVTDWVDDSEDIDLPHNTRSIYVTPAISDITALLQNIDLTAVDGNGNPVDITTDVTVLSKKTVSNNVPTDDSEDLTYVPSYHSLEVKANTTIYNKIHSFTLNKIINGLNYPSNTVMINQAAGELTLTAPTTLTSGNTSFSLDASNKPASWTDANITLSVGGDSYTLITSDATLSDKQFKVTSEGNVTFSPALQSGQKVVIKIKAGDAPEKTVEITVAGS